MLLINRHLPDLFLYIERREKERMFDLMENRHMQGHRKIDKKLKQNQEFLMKNTLSPQASVWTRWHQQRLLESEMAKDFSNAPNQKYIAVS